MMTRDEAIALRSQIYTGSEEFRKQLAGADVDSYVRLGMLKLDEPKSEAEIMVSHIVAALEGRLFMHGCVLHEMTKNDAADIALSLRHAGLKIVENK